MRSVSVMELRKGLGAILDEVRLSSEIVILERVGKPIAKICPLTPEETTSSAGKVRALYELKGLYGKESSRGAKPEAWVETE